jgi:UDP-N-acetyl-L-fucosamine synthase
VKVMTVVGTRPEIIRLSRVILRLDQHVDHTLVHTGQNWDRQLNEVFFEDLALRPPDYHLGVDVSSLGRVLGDVLAKIEPVLQEVRPDAFLVLGDTNSCIAAIMAKRLGIPVFHMEAGNRCFDENVPEETNRRLIDHVADFNLCYTEHARRNLLAEGLHPRRVYVTGSPMREVLDAYADQIESSDALDRHELTPGGYLLVSMHREENVDNPENLGGLLQAIVSLQASMGLRVVVSTHPRLRDRLERQEPRVDISTLELAEPFGYLDFVKLQRNARCVVSDSGTISEESAILGFPAITIRNAIERPEALDAGSLILTGLASEAIERAVQLVVSDWDAGHLSEMPIEYQVRDCSHRVVRLITGLAGLHHQWSNVEPRFLSLPEADKV